MKELYLIRHAKSDWEHAHLDDFDRPLNDRGLRDAPRVARGVASTLPRPQTIITSPATRAYQTASFFRREWAIRWEDFRFDEKIYEASPQVLLSILDEELTRFDRIALVGHNPGLSMVMHHLTGEEAELKTCCLARIGTSAPSFTSGGGKLLELIHPRDL